MRSVKTLAERQAWMRAEMIARGVNPPKDIGSAIAAARARERARYLSQREFAIERSRLTKSKNDDVRRRQASARVRAGAGVCADRAVKQVYRPLQEDMFPGLVDSELRG